MDWIFNCGRTIRERRANLKLVWVSHRAFFRIASGLRSNAEQIAEVRKHLALHGAPYKLSDDIAGKLQSSPRTRMRLPANFIKNPITFMCTKCGKYHQNRCRHCGAGPKCCICQPQPPKEDF